MPSCQILQQPGYAHSPAAQSQDDHVQGTTSFLTDEHGFRSLDFDLLVKTGAETPQKQENATL